MGYKIVIVGATDDHHIELDRLEAGSHRGVHSAHDPLELVALRQLPAIRIALLGLLLLALLLRNILTSMK